MLEVITKLHKKLETSNLALYYSRIPSYLAPEFRELVDWGMYNLDPEGSIVMEPILNGSYFLIAPSGSENILIEFRSEYWMSAKYSFGIRGAYY